MQLPRCVFSDRGLGLGVGCDRGNYQKLIYMNSKPKKKTQVFKDGQVEGYEIGQTVEMLQCPLCDGSGEINDDDPDGIPYRRKAEGRRLSWQEEENIFFALCHRV
ncbi:MAG: hypothetical protein ACYTXC_16270 [Nostoc sp.]